MPKMNTAEFDYVARNIFRPVYPVVASQIVAYSGFTRGSCLDIGCGGGYLGIALAQQTDLFMRFLDPSPEMLDIVRDNLARTGLDRRSEVLSGQAENIPLPDNATDLAISRGSIFFWEDLVRAFQEIHRVLTPGGMAYLGGGFGSSRLKQTIARAWEEHERDPSPWHEHMKRNLSPDTQRRFQDALIQAAIPDHEIIHDQEVGLWIIIRKER
jgi:SAM-dependent methyltransferase